ARRAFRRRAAARGHRALARHAPDDSVRGRANRQPRLEDGRRDPRPDPRLCGLVRPDHGHGHARAARGLDRRPDSLPLRRVDREGATRGNRGRRAGRHEQPALMLLVALKGLAGRKLRAFLTASAIVLGVAMISGTYILTDTIKSAFSTVF